MTRKLGSLKSLILATTVYIFLIALSFYFLTVLSAREVGDIIFVLAGIAVLGLFVFSIISIFFAICSAFGVGLFRLSVLVVSYICIVLSFSSTYFIFQAITEQSKAIDQAWIERGRQWSRDSRLAFKRDEPMIWEYANPGSRVEDPIRLRIKSSSSLVELIADSFHFSVATLATLGSGDMKPNVWYTKLLADIECLIGISMIGLALGLYIKNKGDS